MKRTRRLPGLLILATLFTMLLAGSSFAATLSARAYTLSYKGYIAWSDFTVPVADKVTVNISTSTVNKTALSKKTMNALKYEIVNLASGKVVKTYTRYGSNRYTQEKSSATKVYDLIIVSLPAGSYRFRVTDTAATAQPVHLSYSVTDTRADSANSVVVVPVTVTVGKTITVPIRNNKGNEVKPSSAASSNKKIATVKRSGSNVLVTGVKAGTCNVTIRYRGKKYTFKVTVQKETPDFKAYIKKISAKRKYMYVRVYNNSKKTMKFYSARAAEYEVSTADNNKAYSVKTASLKLAGGKKAVYVRPGKWATLKYQRKTGYYPNWNLDGIEVRLIFRTNSTQYIAAVEDSWLDGQYCLRKKPAAWYPANSAKNNFKAG